MTSTAVRPRADSLRRRRLVSYSRAPPDAPRSLARPPVALFFTGVVHSHYSYYNVSSETQVACRRLFEVGAFLCELFVFAYLGLQVATMNHAFDFGLFISGIPLAVLSRAVMIVPCTKLINRYRKNKLPDNMMRMMLAVGLRGAVAYGLVVNMPSGHERGEGQEGLGIPAIETATLLIAVGYLSSLRAIARPLAHSITRPNSFLSSHHQPTIPGRLLPRPRIRDGPAPEAL